MQRMLQQNQLTHSLPADLESYTQAVIVKPATFMMSPLPGQLGSVNLLRIFMSQMKNVVRIAEVKYPKAEGWKHV